jgi:hypothetical protein
LNLDNLFNNSSVLDDVFGVNVTALLNDLFGGNASGNDAGSTVDDNKTGSIWDSIFGGNSTGSLIDRIIDMITGNDKKDDKKSETPVVKNSIKSSNLKTYYDKKTTFKVTVMVDGKPVTSGKVTFTINNKKYTVSIGKNGVATLKLKLKPGKYTVTSKYGKVSAKNSITVKKSIITKNLSKKYKKAGKFTVKVLNSKGKPHAKQKVTVKIKGKTYKATTNKKGIATIKLPKSLKVGKYTIKTTCKGLTVSNKLTVKK